MHKKLNGYHKKFTIFKKLNSQTKEKEDLNEKVKGNAGDRFNELYYLYKERYSEEKNGLKTKDTKKFDYKKLRLADDYEYEYEEEKKQNDRKPKKIESPKNPKI